MNRVLIEKGNVLLWLRRSYRRQRKIIVPTQVRVIEKMKKNIKVRILRGILTGMIRNVSPEHLTPEDNHYDRT